MIAKLAIERDGKREQVLVQLDLLPLQEVAPCPEPGDRLRQAALGRGYRIQHQPHGYWLIESGKGKGTFYLDLRSLKQAIYALPKPKDPYHPPVGKLWPKWNEMRPIPLPRELIDPQSPSAYIEEALTYYFKNVPPDQMSDVVARMLHEDSRKELNKDACITFFPVKRGGG